MRTMKVTLDDGTIVDVPSQQRAIRSNQISGPPRPSRFVDDPLPHPDYDFEPIIGNGGWRGYRKTET